MLFYTATIDTLRLLEVKPVAVSSYVDCWVQLYARPFLATYNYARHQVLWLKKHMWAITLRPLLFTLFKLQRNDDIILTHKFSRKYFGLSLESSSTPLDVWEKDGHVAGKQLLYKTTLSILTGRIFQNLKI